MVMATSLERTSSNHSGCLIWYARWRYRHACATTDAPSAMGFDVRDESSGSLIAPLPSPPLYISITPLYVLYNGAKHLAILVFSIEPFQLVDQFFDHAQPALPEFGIARVKAERLEQFSV